MHVDARGQGTADRPPGSTFTDGEASVRAHSAYFGESNEDLLERIAVGLSRREGWEVGPEDVLAGFLRNTAGLTPGEQAEVLGGFLETARAASPPPRPPAARPTNTTPQRPTNTTPQRPTNTTPQRPTNAPPQRAGTPPPANRPAANAPSGGGGGRSAGDIFGQISGGLTQALSLFGQGAGLVSQFSQMFGGNSRTAQDISRVAGQLSQGSNTIGGLLQGLQGGQVPQLPGPAAPPPTPGGAPPPTPPSPVGAEPPPTPPGPGPAPTPGGPLDATAMLSLFMSSPQLQQALRTMPMLGQAAPTTMQLPTQGAQGGANVPVTALLNTLSALAARSAREIAELHGAGEAFVEDYLVDSYGRMLVDPAVADHRAAVALQRWRVAAESERFDEAAGGHLDESDSWLMEAGFESAFFDAGRI